MDFFKYKIVQFASDRLDQMGNPYIETHVQIKEFNETQTFWTGIKTDYKTFTNYNRGVYPLEPFEYIHQKNYKFQHEWINIVLYNHYIKHLIGPDSRLIEAIEREVIDSVKLLNGFSSFNHCLMGFMLDYERPDWDDDFDDNKPRYAEYAPYHRLLDLFIQFQFETQALLTKDSNNKKQLLEKIQKSKYLGEDLLPYFQNFLKWCVNSKINLLTEKDYDWVMEV
ncbi:hypothetical protein OAQ99_07760 [Candidatus Kapabacteria bacterium]|nr:hypothetical protein [Candidatus Kapabacteria bacterium]